MPRASQRLFALLPMIAIHGGLIAMLTGCAGLPEQGGGQYYESSFNDHNRAPASMGPPAVAADGQSIDPTYIRTQADYHFAMGEAHALNGERQKAIEEFKMVLVYDPSSPTVRLRLATEYLKTGFVSESVEQAEEALKLDPKSVDAHLLLGGLYSSMRAYDKAVAQYEGVLKLDPANNEAPLYLGAVWSEQKQFEKAVKSFESLAKNPDYPNPHLAWYYIGRVRMDQKDPRADKAAEKAFRKALEIKPDHVDSVVALSSMYTKRDQEPKALQTLATWQKEQGPSARVAEILAQLYIEKSKYDEAYEQLEILERSGDDPLSAKLRMALILIERKLYQPAVDKLTDILAEAPDSDKVRFYLAAVYEESKKDEEAIAHFRKIPAESQYYEESVVHAAYLLKGLSRLDEAVGLVETALTKKKDHPQLYAMYASLLDEKGDYRKAVVSLEDALKRFPDNAQLRFYYGTVHDRLGDKDKVIAEMKKVIEIDPNHVQGLNYLAFTWAEEGRHLDEAEKLARRASELDPQDGYVLDTLGWILFKRGSVPEAIRFLEAAHRVQPSVGVIAEHLGDAYLSGSMVDKAMSMYQKALRLETDGKKIEEIKSKITTAGRQRGLPPASAERAPAGAD